jgi:predicted secreted protein
LKSYTLSGEALHAFDAAHGFDELFAIFTAGELIKVKFSTDETGDTFWSGDALITSLTLNAPQDDLRSMSYSIEGSGALTAGTVI